ncbi:MAG TPA: glycogen debranching N-terminal domain-containing protein [Polyangiaceae bacterium]|nr:glycogen debranching N-terminal domain-containing protein [Polyangiaceae bacterium]
MNDSSIVLRPLRSDGVISRGRSVFAGGKTGFLDGAGETGLWVDETRLLSRQSYRVDGVEPTLITASNVQQHVSLGYFILASPGQPPDTTDSAQQTLELELTRVVGEGLSEDVALRNYTQRETEFELCLELDADFADWGEPAGVEPYARRVTRHLRSDAGKSELVFDCRAEHTHEELGDAITRSIHRRLVVAVEPQDSPLEWWEHGVRFRVKLPPKGAFRARITYAAEIDGARLRLPRCGSSFGPDEWERRTERLVATSTTLSREPHGSMRGVVTSAFERALRDLYALHLYDLDRDVQGVTLAAGAPGYLGLFGRDSLITGFQSTLVDSKILASALEALGHHLGTTSNDFRDEQPDKLLHEMHPGPAATLGVTPHGRYYGGVSASLQYPAFVSSLWHWTGDEALVRRFVPIAHRALRWIARYGDLDGDGFVEYDRRSKKGGKNQGWKDSGDAIVYADGSQVEDPLGTCEMQASLYASLTSFGEFLGDLGDAEGSERLAHEARALRHRFNEVYWMEDEGFYAMGQDSENRPIRSIASNGGHVLTTGIADPLRARRVADRLFEADLFSGWGVRTLSSDHPAYNPWSYHRGSVWPAENAFFVYGMARYGLYVQMHALARAQFEASALFELHRLPEVFAGHPRDAEHPFPAIYPRANSPQSWSSSAIVMLVRAMLGIAPYAPLDALLVDPHLPEWLPEITLHGLRVGRSSVSIRFWRTPTGDTEFEVLETVGTLRVIRDVGALGASGRSARARAALARG